MSAVTRRNALKVAAAGVALAALALAAGCQGVVASAQEASALRSELEGDFVIVTPGVRPLGTNPDDQARVVTPAEAIAAHVEHGSRVPEVSATMHLYPINGACHRVGPADTAFAYRDAKYGMVFLASWTDPAKDAERIQWVRDYYQALAPYSEPGGYINFMQDDDYHKIRDNYRQNYDRLVQVKRAYDPGNLFHINQNITP